MCLPCAGKFHLEMQMLSSRSDQHLPRGRRVWSSSVISHQKQLLEKHWAIFRTQCPVGTLSRGSGCTAHPASSYTEHPSAMSPPPCELPFSRVFPSLTCHCAPLCSPSLCASDTPHSAYPRGSLLCPPAVTWVPWYLWAPLLTLGLACWLVSGHLVFLSSFLPYYSQGRGWLPFTCAERMHTAGGGSR